MVLTGLPWPLPRAESARIGCHQRPECVYNVAVVSDRAAWSRPGCEGSLQVEGSRMLQRMVFRSMVVAASSWLGAASVLAQDTPEPPPPAQSQPAENAPPRPEPRPRRFNRGQPS